MTARVLAAECLRVAAVLVEAGDLLAARCVLGDVHALLDELGSREPRGTRGPVEIACNLLSAPLLAEDSERSRLNAGRGEAVAWLLAARGT